MDVFATGICYILVQTIEVCTGYDNYSAMHGILVCTDDGVYHVPGAFDAVFIVCVPSGKVQHELQHRSPMNHSPNITGVDIK